MNRLPLRLSAVSPVIPVPVKVERAPFEKEREVRSALSLRLREVTAPSPEVPVKEVRELELRLSVAREGDVV